MTLKQVLQAAIVAAFGALSSTEALAQDVIPPLSGQSGRVVILDASGSMRNLSFASPERERMQVARGFLATTFSELADTGDTVPTSLVVFGGDQALTWDSVRTRHGGNPQNYPYTGPLCRDSRVLMPLRHDRCPRRRCRDHHRERDAMGWHDVDPCVDQSGACVVRPRHRWTDHPDFRYG